MGKVAPKKLTTPGRKPKTHDAVGALVAQSAEVSSAELEKEFREDVEAQTLSTPPVIVVDDTELPPPEHEWVTDHLPVPEPVPEPEVEPENEVEVERPIVQPEKREPQVLFKLPLPSWMGALSLGTFTDLPADVRSAIMGRLGCLFSITDGRIKTIDGRFMRAERVIEPGKDDAPPVDQLVITEDLTP
jgi:hypothetical protein